MTTLTAAMQEALAEVELIDVERIDRPWGPGAGRALEQFQRPWSFHWDPDEPVPDIRPLVRCAEGCGRVLRAGVRCDCLPPIPGLRHSDETWSFTSWDDVVTDTSWPITDPQQWWFTPGATISWSIIDEPLTEPIVPTTDDWFEREARRRDENGKVRLGEYELDLPYLTDRPMLAKPEGLAASTVEHLRYRGALRTQTDGGRVLADPRKEARCGS